MILVEVVALACVELHYRAGVAGFLSAIFFDALDGRVLYLFGDVFERDQDACFHARTRFFGGLRDAGGGQTARGDDEAVGRDEGSGAGADADGGEAEMVE